MATTNGNGSPGPAPQQQPPLPQLQILAQYIKDLSFENPNAPRSLQPPAQQPKINIQINVNVKQLAESDFEIELKLEGRAELTELFLFNVDLLYAGVFRLNNIPPESVQLVLMIECPRMLFPFAREIMATATRNGGFPPLYLDPVDFADLYRRRMAELAPQPGQPSA